jgi:hypothetical protein
LACLSTLVDRPFVGLLLDRVFAPQVATAFFLAPVAGLPLLASGSGLSPAIGAALLGLALGAEIDLIAFLTTRYLGQRAFGEIYGYLFMAFILGASVGGLSRRRQLRPLGFLYASADRVRRRARGGGVPRPTGLDPTSTCRSR